MKWLSRPLICNDAVVMEPLNPARLTDADLRTISLRMRAIFHTIEMPRAEERWIPIALFDAIDTLEGMVLHGQRSPDGHSSPARLVEWTGVIRDFGAHYELAGTEPISIDPAIYREVAARYNDAVK